MCENKFDLVSAIYLFMVTMEMSGLLYSTIFEAGSVVNIIKWFEFLMSPCHKFGEIQQTNEVIAVRLSLLKKSSN